MAKTSAIVEQQAELSADPTTPPSGYSIIYPKTDGKWYARNSAGTVREVTNVAGGGSTDVKQTEIDFGTVPVKNKKFTITDGDVSPSNQIMASVSYDNPTGGIDDDAEWFENLIVMARAGTGQFFLYCNSPYNDMHGLVKINYLIG